MLSIVYSRQGIEETFRSLVLSEERVYKEFLPSSDILNSLYWNHS